MDKQYIVGDSEISFGEGEFHIITAKSSDEAINKFIKEFAVQEDIFLTHVYDKSINMSFATKFWLQNQEDEDRYMESAEALISEDEFKSRVYDFFGTDRNHADIFIDYYFSDEDEEDAKEKELFTQDMLVHMWTGLPFCKVEAFELEKK